MAISNDLDNLHQLEYCHKDLNSGNILQETSIYLSDFRLSRTASEQKLDDKIYMLPYITSEVLNRKTYTNASDIYSFCIIMAKMSSSKPSFYNKRHD